MALSKGRPAQNFVSFPALKRALLSAAGGAALLIIDQSAAWAACSPSAANDVVAICDGTITTQYGSGAETNGSPRGQRSRSAMAATPAPWAQAP